VIAQYVKLFILVATINFAAFSMASKLAEWFLLGAWVYWLFAVLAILLMHILFYEH
jgi:hypothetical protein